MRDTFRSSQLQKPLTQCPSAYEFNTIEHAHIVRGTLRTGVTMNGVFCNKYIPKGTFLCAWTGVMCKDTDENMIDSNLVNAYDISKYGMSFLYAYQKYMYICPPLDNEGNPLCSKTDVENEFRIERGNPQQTMAVFLNEPSPDEHCVVDQSRPIVRPGAIAANVCLYPKRESGSVVGLLFATRNIEKGEELTLMYEADPKQHSFDRTNFRFNADFTSLTVERPYNVHTDSQMTCPGDIRANVAPRMKPLDIVRRVSETTFFAGDDSTNAIRRTNLLAIKMEADIEANKKGERPARHFVLDQTRPGRLKVARMNRRVVDDEKVWNARANEWKEKVFEQRTILRQGLQLGHGRKHIRYRLSFIKDVLTDMRPESPFKVILVKDVEDAIAVYRILHRIFDYGAKNSARITPHFIVGANEHDTLESWDDWEGTNTHKVVLRIFNALDRLSVAIPYVDQLYTYDDDTFVESIEVHIKKRRLSGMNLARPVPNNLETHKTFESIIDAYKKYLTEFVLYDEGRHDFVASDLHEMAEPCIALIAEYSRLASSDRGRTLQWIANADYRISILKEFALHLSTRSLESRK